MYHEELMEHYKYPLNQKTFDKPSFFSRQYNPSCGDEVQVQGIVEKGILIDVGFVGSGCVISQAAASMVTDYCKGRAVSEIHEILPKVVFDLIGINLGPVRGKCALLILQALKQGLQTKKIENSSIGISL